MVGEDTPQHLEMARHSPCALHWVDVPEAARYTCPTITDKDHIAEIEQEETMFSRSDSPVRGDRFKIEVQ